MCDYAHMLTDTNYGAHIMYTSLDGTFTTYNYVVETYLLACLVLAYIYFPTPLESCICIHFYLVGIKYNVCEIQMIAVYLSLVPRPAPVRLHESCHRAWYL